MDIFKSKTHFQEASIQQRTSHPEDTVKILPSWIVLVNSTKKKREKNQRRKGIMEELLMYLIWNYIKSKQNYFIITGFYWNILLVTDSF